MRLVSALFVNLLADLWQRPNIVSLHVQNYAATQQHKRIPRDFHGSLTEPKLSMFLFSSDRAARLHRGNIGDISNLTSKGVGHGRANNFSCELPSLEPGFCRALTLVQSPQALPLPALQQRWL
jgi:hypothetical protein